MSLPPGTDLSKIPALEPPPGVIPDFVNPPSLAKTLIIVNVIFMVLMVIFVALRVYSKALVIRAMGWDDYTCLISAALAIFHTSVIIERKLHHSCFLSRHKVTDGTTETRHGYGKHQWDVPVSTLTSSDVHVLQLDPITYYLTVLFIKLSILLLYLRIFSINTIMKYLIYFAILIQTLAYLALIGVSIGLEVLCTAETAATRSFCINNFKVTDFQAVFNVVTDFFIILLPIVKVWNLHLSVRRKVGVTVVFLTGLLACVTSLIRSVIVIDRVHSQDSLWNSGYVSIYSAVEINTGIISGSLIALPAFFHKYHIKPFGITIFSSLRSRLFGRSKDSSSRHKGRFSGTPSKGSDGTAGIQRGDSYIQLNSLPKSMSTERQNPEILTLESRGGPASQEHGGIVRTDDYMVTYPESDHNGLYAEV